MSRGLLAVVVLVLTQTPTFADSKLDPKAKARAGELAAESADHYKRGEFEIAAALLRQAYALYPEPNLLYNLARSLESLGDAKGAVEAYKNYLAANGNVEDRGAIERRISTLEAEIADKEKRDKPVATVAPSPIERRPDPRDELPVAPGLSPLPWVVIAGGVGLVVGGALVGVQASDRHDQAIAEPMALEAERLQESAKTRATLSTVLFVAGGLATAGGIVWEIRDRKHRRDAMIRAKGSFVQLELAW